MHKKKLLQKLKALLEIEEVKDGFPSQHACIDWANKVAPLLKFDQEYYANFMQNAHKMNLKLSSYTLVPAFNIMVSQLQMAINELEDEEDEVVGNMGNSYSWITIAKEFGITKKEFGRKINFVKSDFQRSIIFRDIEHAYILAKNGFSKPSVILSGAIIEELLRQYLIQKKIKPSDNTFDEYIKACRNKDILKKAIHSLSDSVRYFRNIVHIKEEKSKKYSISKATAIGAVSSIFTIVNDF
ncbi:hypothetical protein KKC91_05310 [bacterium]|nr:hypothetical protein [bacterium]